MALKSNKDAGTSATADETALATINDEEAAVSVVNPANMELGSTGGDYGAVQIRLPYLQVGHAMGKLDKFVKGSLIISPDNLIAGPKEPVFITILSTQLYWKEYIGSGMYDPNYTPKTFLTEQECWDAGETTRWEGKGNPACSYTKRALLTDKRIPPTFKQAQSAKILVQQPEGLISGLFGDFKLGGKSWTPAMWNVDKTAADSIIPKLAQDLLFSLRTRGIYSAVYELTTKPEQWNTGNVSYVPVIKLHHWHAPEDIEIIKSVFASAIAEPINVTDEEIVEADDVKTDPA